MRDFRCVPIDSEVGDRWRQTGMDDSGNRLRRIVANGVGEPCRHCLREADAGDDMLLGSYKMTRPQGIYWTPSPIFVHAAECASFTQTSVIAPILRNRLISVRAYDAEDQCVYDLGHAGDGNEIDAPVARALDDTRTAFVNIHTARPGCMLCRVERV